MDKIKVCDNHREYLVPLIWTFVFPGAEYWCPHCGMAGGMFGTGRDVDSTPELEKRVERYKAESEDYLQAMGRRACVYMEYEGKKITYDELPEHEKEKGQKAIKAWNKRVKDNG